MLFRYFVGKLSTEHFSDQKIKYLVVVEISTLLEIYLKCFVKNFYVFSKLESM